MSGAATTSRPRRTTWIWLVGGGVALFGAVVLITFLVATHGRTAPARQTAASSPTASASPSPTSAPRVDAQQAAALGTALASQDTSTVGPVLAPALRATFDAAPQPLLAPGSKVTLDLDHQIVDGGSATVPMTVSGGDQAGDYLLLLVRDGDTWLVLGTQATS